MEQSWNRTLFLLGMLITSVVMCSVASGADGVQFALGSPHILKAEHGSSRLKTADINSDGLLDIVTINNSTSLLEIYKQKKSDGEIIFEKIEEPLDDVVMDISMGDFNRDKKTDIVLAFRKKSPVIKYQNKDGDLGEGKPFDCEGGYLSVNDLDNDGLSDLLVLTKEKLQIFHGSKTEGIEEGKPLILFNSSDIGSLPVVCDFDGNGLLDLLYTDSQQRSSTMVRFQTSARSWGLESGFESSEVTALISMELRKGKSPLLATIDSKTKELRLYRNKGQDEALVRFPMAGPFFPSMEAGKQSGGESLLACDLYGKGLKSLLAASPQSAEVNLFLQETKGEFTSRVAASLSDITSLVSLPLNKGALVFSLSNREETIGASVYDASRGLTIPKILDSKRKPLAIAAVCGEGNIGGDLLFLFKDEEDNICLSRIVKMKEPKDLNSPAKEIILPVSSDDEPVAMLAGDVNADGKMDLLIFNSYSPMRLVLGSDEGFSTYATDQGMKKGIFDKLRPAQVALGDLDRDGHDEILIARENFMRAYRIDAKGGLDLVEQLNGKNIASRISSVVLANLDGSGEPEVVLLDSANNLLTIYSRESTGGYELARHHAIEGSKGQRLLAADFNGDGKDDMAVYQNDRLQLFYSGKSTANLSSVWRKKPKEKENSYGRIFAVNILADSNSDQLIALENKDHLLEFYQMAGEGDTQKMQRFFKFKVFDSPGSSSGASYSYSQPRELTSADLDGDGLKDLLLLVHDNIIYYLQKGASQK